MIRISWVCNGFRHECLCNSLSDVSGVLYVLDSSDVSEIDVCDTKGVHLNV